jgi:hypothetical protein
MWRHSGDLLGRLGRVAELLVDVKSEVELRDRTDSSGEAATASCRLPLDNRRGAEVLLCRIGCADELPSDGEVEGERMQG